MMNGRLIALGLILIFLFPFRVSHSQMSESEISEIQRAIKAQGFSWTAGENDITRMPDAERKVMLGGILLPTNIPSSPPPETAPWMNLPSAFSWGDKDGHNWMTPIRQQGYCGSCWAFAAAGAFEAKQKIRLNDYSISPDISEQTMVSCWNWGCGQAYIDSVLFKFKNLGVPDEACFPYLSDDGMVRPCANRCADWKTRSYYIDSYDSYSNSNRDTMINAMKTEIMTGGPIIVPMIAYADFQTYNGGIYQHAFIDVNPDHVVVLYGWDDVDSCWLGKNSWGTGWGETGPNGTRGWFRIKMGSSGTKLEDIFFFHLQP
jgi:C1A family cysteine protease